MPGSIPRYGKLHVTEEGLTREVGDPTSHLPDVLRAFEASGGSVRRTVVALNEAGIPSPRGKRWGVSTIRRIVETNGADMPDPSPRGVRRAVGTRAVLAGLLRCHCGRRMTPNAQRGQVLLRRRPRHRAQPARPVQRD